MKVWAVAAMFGTPADGQMVVATWFDDLAEVATARFIAAYYQQAENPLPLVGVSVRELTGEFLENALKATRENDPKPPLRLVMPEPPEAS